MITALISKDSVPMTPIYHKGLIYMRQVGPSGNDNFSYKLPVTNNFVPITPIKRGCLYEAGCPTGNGNFSYKQHVTNNCCNQQDTSVGTVIFSKSAEDNDVGVNANLLYRFAKDSQVKDVTIEKQIEQNRSVQ